MSRSAYVVMRRCPDGLEHVRDAATLEEARKACGQDSSLVAMSRDAALKAWMGQKHTVALANSIRVGSEH